MVISTMASSDFSPGFPLDFTSSAYTSGYGGCGPPTGWDLSCSVAYFHHIPLSLRRGVLQCCTSGSLHLPWPSLSLTSSALPCSPLGANISTLQDSLYVTGYGFAPLSPGVTSLQHSQSPGCTGCLLRGLLAVTTTGLSSASRRQLSGHTSHMLGGRSHQ